MVGIRRAAVNLLAPHSRHGEKTLGVRIGKNSELAPGQLGIRATVDIDCCTGAPWAAKQANWSTSGNLSTSPNHLRI